MEIEASAKSARDFIDRVLEEGKMTRKKFTGFLTDMYYRDDWERQNAKNFIFCAIDHGIENDLFWPNYQSAPWHLQAEINGYVINFWPHKEKAHVAYESKVAYGLPAMFDTVRRVQNDTLDDFDLVEREQ